MTRRPVIAAIDTSDSSRTAAHWAAREAARRGAPLRLVHSRPFLGRLETDPIKIADLQAEARGMLAEAAAEIRAVHPGLEVATSLLFEQAVDSLLAVGGKGELLVLGTRGLGGFHGLLVGSVSLAVAARSETPVVLVRTDQPHPVTATTQDTVPEVVVGLDPAQPAGPVIEFSFLEAELRGARLRVVHGWDLPAGYGYAGWVPPETERRELGALAARLVSDAVAPWREKFPLVEVVEEVRPGGAASALVTAGAEADLVVVGRRTRSHRLGLRLGPVAHAVIHHCPAPVAVVAHV